jgi:hypothetical protein
MRLIIGEIWMSSLLLVIFISVSIFEMCTRHEPWPPCARFGPLRTRSNPRVPKRELRVVYKTAHTLDRSISGIWLPNGAQGNATQLLYSSDEVAYLTVLSQVTGAQRGLSYTL